MAANLDQKALKEYIKDAEKLETKDPEQVKAKDLAKEAAKLAALMAIGRQIR